MILFSTVLVIFLLVTHTAAHNAVGGRMLRKDEARAHQVEAAKRFQRHAGLGSESANAKRSGVKNITFTNPRASEFWVNGSAIPLVGFDVGPSWAGLLPISNHPNETRKLFFWFFPPGPEGSLDDLIFWTNGGPGCSSLEGFLQENGPISWSWGQAQPTVNEHSWTNLSSVLWIEQPVGTGFSQGTPNIENEEQLAEQLVGFMQQFLEVFSELKGKRFWLTGESYGGFYIPYIANYIYEHPALLDLSLQGIWINDPVLSYSVLQSQIPAVGFVHKYQGLFSFNQTFMEFLDRTAATCNYTNYVSSYVTYPPKGPLPFPGGSHLVADECNIWNDIYTAALVLNPAFNVYRIWDTYPALWDVLGYPAGPDSPNYFNRRAVKEAIHAPVDTEWTDCAQVNVFPNGDRSVPPAVSVLPNVIERSTRTVIVHGLADFILIAEGTRIVIQNMTWNGLQGFQTPIANDSFLVDGVGAYGTAHTERGLTYVEVVLSGHMVPQFAPVAAFQIMQYLMGFRDTP